MANKPAGYASTKLYIAVTAADGNIPLQQETDLDEAAFAALNFSLISKCITAPAIGGQSNFISQAYIDQPVEESIETTVALPDGTINYREQIGDNGQTAVKAAGEVHSGNFVFMHELNDAPSSSGTPTKRYFRGLVGRAMYPEGGTEDWQRVEHQFKGNQLPVITEASA